MTPAEAYKIMEAAFHACEAEPQPDMILVHPRYWELQKEAEMLDADEFRAVAERYLREKDWTQERGERMADAVLVLAERLREAQDELQAQARAFGRAQQATQQEAPEPNYAMTDLKACPCGRKDMHLAGPACEPYLKQVLSTAKHAVLYDYADNQTGQAILPNGVLARGPFPKPTPGVWPPPALGQPKMCACRFYEYGAIHALTGPCDLGNPWARQNSQKALTQGDPDRK